MYGLGAATVACLAAAVASALADWPLGVWAFVVAASALGGSVIAELLIDHQRAAEPQGCHDQTADPHRGVDPVTDRVPASFEPATVLATLGESLSVIGDVVGTSLWLADAASGTLRQVAATGPMAAGARPIRLDADDVVSAAHGHRTVEVREIARLSAGGGPVGVVHRIAIPVGTAEHQGVATVDVSSDGALDVTPVPARTAPLRSSLAASLALSVAQDELESARELVGVARDLSRMLDEREVLETALVRAMQLSDAATGSVMLLNTGTGRLGIAVARGLPDDVVRDTSLAEGEGIAGWVLSTGKPVLVEDLPTRSPSARRHGVRSAVSVPLADADGVLGVLNVGSRAFPARFTDSHMAALELLGRQTATALRNARAVTQSREMYFDTLKALALAMETKDPYSAGGTERVLQFADALAAAFVLPEDEREAIRIAALLHDLGMASVGEAVATSDRTLTTVERALLKVHPQIAAEMLAEAPALKRVVPIVYHHHEAYDGSGYLGGLAGEAIPLGARILAVADAFVAMTSDRPYRKALSVREALRELTDKAGTQFDPLVVDALRGIVGDGSDRVPGPSGRT